MHIQVGRYMHAFVCVHAMNTGSTLTCEQKETKSQGEKPWPRLNTGSEAWLPVPTPIPTDPFYSKSTSLPRDFQRQLGSLNILLHLVCLRPRRKAVWA